MYLCLRRKGSGPFLGERQRETRLISLRVIYFPLPLFATVRSMYVERRQRMCVHEKPRLKVCPWEIMLPFFLLPLSLHHIQLEISPEACKYIDAPPPARVHLASCRSCQLLSTNCVCSGQSLVPSFCALERRDVLLM